MPNILFKNITDGQRNIENKIYTLAKNKGLSSEEIEPIPDGVGDIKAYCESSPRIMWILKEAYDNYVEGKPAGGEWNLYDEFDNEKAWTIKTWQVIAYIVYGIRKHMHWTDMPWISEKTSMIDDLRGVALLNMSKMPAYSSSPADMTPQYEIWRSILFEQIELYKPNIICFGGTFKYFKKDLGLTDTEPIDGARVYKRESQLLLDLYHPQQRTISRGDYVDNVIDCIEKWYNH